jgi:myo-inositol-1(or 4)-monophosphatase
LPVAEVAPSASYTSVLASAVREAGELALTKFRGSFRSWTKGFDSPVSEVDIAVDDLLRRRLVGMAPGDAWLSEESVDAPQRLTARHVWIVDPIDGTRAFIAGREDWTISAALVREGRPIAGALYAPVDDLMFLATAGGGFTLNGRAVDAEAPGRAAGLRIAGPKRYVDMLARRMPVEALPRIHSLALRLARVSSGAVDVAIAGGNSHDWDLAAADLIVHEAGGLLTDLDGQQVMYNRPVPTHGILMAAGRSRHDDVRRVLCGDAARK